MMKHFCIILLIAALFGCSKAEEEIHAENTAINKAAERAAGKTAVKAYKQTEDIMADVKTSTDARANDLEDFKK